MTTNVTSNEYPQKVSVDTDNTANLRDVRGPNFFKFGENIGFNRVAEIRSICVSGAEADIVCGTKPGINRTVWTHETSMHQIRSNPDETSRLFHIRIHFWSDDIFRVRFGEQEITDGEPDFLPKEYRMLVGEPECITVKVNEEADRWRLSTASITLEIEKKPFRLSARTMDGRVFWQQCKRKIAPTDVFDMSVAHADNRTGVFESFYLSPQEKIYGLGERFDHLERNGKPVDFWNKDAVGTSSRRTYINVPFFLSTEGYGLLVNDSHRTEWEIGTLDAFTAGFGVESDTMDYFVIRGDTPAAILRRYWQLTGTPPVPPVWSFGLWMSRNSYLSWDVVHEVADTLRERKIPADVLHLDTAWFQEDWNCDLRFSRDRFADPERNISELRDQGFRISLWQYNFIPPRDNNPNYIEGREKGYFAKTAAGEVYRLPPEAKGSWMDDAVIDFSNPEAVAWYTAQIADLIRLGAATIKTDFGEGIPEDAVYARIDGRSFHNLYSLVYNGVIFDTIQAVSGDSIVWARSGTAGSQRYPIHWGGDSQCTFAGLAGTLRGALSIGLTGFPFFSHDIGGFIGRPSPELYIRWAQFGLFSSHARCHGCGNENSREPWTFGEEANRIFTTYANLRYALLPYIYHQAQESTQSAKALVGALYLEFPNDLNVRSIDDQYMFGGALLVAPVLRPLSETDQRSIYLPEGQWFDYWSHDHYDSRGQWITRTIDLDTMPIFVRAGSIIPYGEQRLSTDNRIGPIVKLEVYAGRPGTLDYHDGEKEFHAEWDEQSLHIKGCDCKPEVLIIRPSL